jgi:hypothetical protein
MDASSPDEFPLLGIVRNGGDEIQSEEEFEFVIDPMCTNCPNLAPKG